MKIPNNRLHENALAFPVPFSHEINHKFHQSIRKRRLARPTALNGRLNLFGRVRLRQKAGPKRAQLPHTTEP
jgi:hypothetical protein